MNNQQAIDLLKGLEQSLDDYCELNDEGKTAFGMAITALELFGNSEQLPSAQPERKTGKWIKFNNSCTIRCNQCGQEMTSLCDIKLPNYCPSCGAYMKDD